MKTFKVLDTVRVDVSKIGLSKEQAEKRAHAVKPSRTKGYYIPGAPLEFKRGEVIKVLKSEIAKIYLPKLEDVEAVEKAIADAEKKAKVEERAKVAAQKKAGAEKDK